MSRLAGRTAKLVIGGVVVLVVLVGVGVWWFFIRDTAPAAFTSDTPIAAGCAKGKRPSSFDGQWTLAADCDSQAGFRITETIGGLADHEAVGRSSKLVGAVTVSGTRVTKGEFSVDLTALEFTDDPGLPVANRARALQGRGLETGRFPTAAFTLAKPLDLGSLPADGQTRSFRIAGQLTLHGVTKALTVAST
jgi:polyisoprenoid-binding protein YceI